MFRIVSIVEAFMATQLVERFEPHAPPPRTPILEDVYTREEDAAISSWPKMLEHYHRWFDIKISQRTCPSWRRIDAMTSVRNAIAHGLGSLTRRMARKDVAQLTRDFATVGVTIDASSLHIPSSALHKSTRTARDFIEWVDAALAAYDESNRSGQA
jgi:hypothetical protein